MKSHREKESQSDPKDKKPDSTSLGASTDNRSIESVLFKGPADYAEPAADGDLPTIPGYTILERIGQGGMGQVFKALQQRLDRVVALKVVRQDRISQDKEAIRRFHREARAAAKLCHPNIVTVHDFDEVGDNCFIAMEYVEGNDLYHLVKERGPLSVEQACDLICQVALGLQHSHERGMVHRDIKPANLLLTKAHGLDPEGLGTVKILDMGMARLHGSGPTESIHGGEDGALMGTPDYMAPEQALQFHDVDIRADLYSLGCTFYFLLTGRPPFDEFPFMKKMMMHQTAPPRSVRELQPKIPPEIDAIVNKLLAKKPEERFQTPGELAASLTKFLERAKLPSDAIGQGALLSPPGRAASPGTGVSAEFTSPVRERIGDPRRAPRALTREERAVPPSTLNVPAESPPAGQEPRPAEEKEKEDPSVIRWKPKKMFQFQATSGGASAVAFGPKRDLLAVGGLQGALRLWEFRDVPREKIVLQTYETQIFCLAFAPDGRTLAWGSGSLDGLVCLGDLTDPTLNTMTLLQGHKGPVDAVAFSPDAKSLATGSRDLTIGLWDLTEVQPLQRAIFKGHKDPIKTLAISPDGKTVVSGSLDGSVRFWRKGGFWSKDQLAVLQGDWGAVNSLGFAPMGQALAFGSQDHSVRIVDLTNDRIQEAAVLQGHQALVRVVLFQPEGTTLVSVCDLGLVILWDLTTGSKIHEWQLAAAEGGGLAFTFDGRYLAMGTADGAVTVIRLYSRRKT
jgi:serine/threonine protein kinase/WD40 repeat protein